MDNIFSENIVYFQSFIKISSETIHNQSPGTLYFYIYAVTVVIVLIIQYEEVLNPIFLRHILVLFCRLRIFRFWLY